MNTAASAAEETTKRLLAVRQGTQEAVGRGVEAVRSALDKLKARLSEVEQAVGKATQTVTDATAKMAEAYQGLTTLVEANLQRQVEAVKARYAQEQAALATSRQSEVARITESTQLLTAALTEQSTLRQQATTATLKLIDDESQARIAAAQPPGTDRAGARGQRPARREHDPRDQTADAGAGAHRVPAAHRCPQCRGQPPPLRGPAHRGAEAAARAVDRGAHPRDPSARG